MNNKIIITLGVTLFLSLSGNMFFLGLWFGSNNYEAVETTMEVKTDNSYQAARIKEVDKELRHQLSKHDRKVLGNHMKRVKQSLRKQKQAVMRARQTVRKAMNAEPFNQEALDLAMKNERKQRQKTHELINSARSQIASKLSPEGRKSFASIEERFSKYSRGQLSNDKMQHQNLRKEHLKKIREQRQEQRNNSN